ncbi:MAG: di-trans,poly-cis-decaprenylcistransferase [Candidatus Woykebacteria bacterium RBG_13_40_15]|uniref:Isoprenyl transferase n=1 Tax=Candidatus Woykebacteria bacterium RBG_13_40_15 TaxID=1802593 RepID=A0A1G1W5E8_9BACT|nr:MAG: di-trans,poly-cis-decaprenylcistransferase [Candidatus Woykebacteria bacterium RBG_13_40_15]
MEKNNAPKHVGIIMDGNRRWAANKNLPSSAGHEAGAENLQRIVEVASKIGIKYLTVYALSTENLKSRKSIEISFLFNTMLKMTKSKFSSLNENGVRLKFIGDLSKLPKNVIKSFKDVEDKLSKNNKLILTAAINYGGRYEIISSVRKVVSDRQEISEDAINSNLYTAGIPEPDLIIRTGGRKRLSNFLLWQGTYSELYFTDTLWPDFNEKELKKALDDFHERVRNFGA